MSPHNPTKVAGYTDYSEIWLCREGAPSETTELLWAEPEGVTQQM